MNCNYCGGETERVTGRDVYPMRPDLYKKRFIKCTPCDAYVGVHVKSDWKPFGMLANRETRMWRQKAHAAFDPLWRSGDMTRTEAYRWLSQKLNIRFEDCHIGEFGIDLCKKVVVAMNGSL